MEATKATASIATAVVVNAMAQVDPIVNVVSKDTGEVGNVLDSQNEYILNGDACKKIPYT